MNTPQKPQDPPDTGASPASNPDGNSPHGIPDDASEYEPKATPNSDRHKTETTPVNT